MVEVAGIDLHVVDVVHAARAGDADLGADVLEAFGHRPGRAAVGRNPESLCRAAYAITDVEMLRIARVDTNVQRSVEVAQLLPRRAGVGALEEPSLGRVERRGAPIERGDVARIHGDSLRDHRLVG